VRCIAGHRGTDSDDEDDEDVDESAKHWARTRTLSISSPDNESRKITADLHISSVPKELTLDYTEISAVPPLPLWLLLAADQGSANLGDSTASGADSLFQPSLETHVRIFCKFLKSVDLINSVIKFFHISGGRRRRFRYHFE
jgi:hypothetical protein